MAYSFTDDTDYPRLTPAVQWLIAINGAIYFLQMTLVSAPDMQLALGFRSRDLGSSWWTIFTYMFVHGGFWHLALNMYTLFLFGPRVEHAWSAGEFTRFYVLCGLGGWLAHLLFGRDSILVGASAAVLGVMLAFAMRWPDDEVYIFGVLPLKVKWLVAALAALNLVSGIAAGASSGPDGGVAYLAHLGGLVAGWLYLRTSSSSGIDRVRQRVSQIPDLPDEPPRPIPRSMPRASREKVQEVDDIVAKSKAAVARRAVMTEPAEPRVAKRSTEQLDHVLDKILERGLESLTPEEHRLLEAESRRLKEG
jgi:membrane associated rhomboid family serine protease